MPLNLQLHPAQQISDAILVWFDQHGRKNLPWQQTRSAYHVWLSEVMLQQTQVVTVIPYFERFIARFPTVGQLASAEIDEVLHLWTGLGYYARARNLHRCAQIITTTYQGVFPKTVAELEALPGIGRSTAGAILSISENCYAPILDGNVKRFLARLHCVPGWPSAPRVQKQLWQIAEHYSPNQRCADYTQAVMDLGALVCTRRNPLCSDCPLEPFCAAKATASQHQFPEPKPKKERPIRLEKLLLIEHDGQILLEKRPSTGIWGGLWSLPELDTFKSKHLLNEIPTSLHSKINHQFTHFILEAEVHLISLQQLPELYLPKKPFEDRTDNVQEAQQYFWYQVEKPAEIGLPGPIYKLLHSTLSF